MLMIPVVYAGICPDPVPVHTNCTMVTPNLVCGTYDYVILNVTGNITSGNLTLLEGMIYTFEWFQPPGEYIVDLCDGTTREVRVEDEGTPMMIAIIILLPMLLSFLFLIGAASLGEDHHVMKISLFLLSIIPFFISMHLALISVVKFYEFTDMQGVIGNTTYWFAIIFGVIVTYFLIYLFYTIVQNMRDKKEKGLEY